MDEGVQWPKELLPTIPVLETHWKCFPGSSLADIKPTASHIPLSTHRKKHQVHIVLGWQTKSKSPMLSQIHPGILCWELPTEPQSSRCLNKFLSGNAERAARPLQVPAPVPPAPVTSVAPIFLPRICCCLERAAGSIQGLPFCWSLVWLAITNESKMIFPSTRSGMQPPAFLGCAVSSQPSKGKGEGFILLLLMFNPSKFPWWRVLPLCPQALPVPLDHRLFLRAVLSTLKVMKNQWKIFPQRLPVCRKRFWFIFLPVPQMASFLNGL